MSSWSCGHSFCCHRQQRLLALFVKTFHICRLDGICCMLVCVEGQMKGPTDKGTCDPSYEINSFLDEPIQSNSIRQLLRCREISLYSNGNKLLCSALQCPVFLEEIAFGKLLLLVPKGRETFVSNHYYLQLISKSIFFPCFQFVHPKVSVKLTLLMFFLVCVIPKTVFYFQIMSQIPDSLKCNVS